MLVLARRKDQSIRIGDEIVIRVLEVDRSGQVRLGIEAPREYRILREELIVEVGAANRAALAASDSALPDLEDLLGEEADGPRP